MNIRLTPLGIAAATVMRAQGMTLAAIAARLGVTGKRLTYTQ